MKKTWYNCPKCNNTFSNISEQKEEVSCICGNKDLKVIKHPGGRPGETIKQKLSKLPENWKDIIFQLASEGCSDVEIRAHFIKLNGLKARAIEHMWYALKENESEFAHTLKIAHELCQAWWEAQSKIHLYHGKEMVFETGSWFANMKNRFGWKDKTDIEHSVPDNLIDKFKDLTVEQLKGKVADLLGK